MLITLRTFSLTGGVEKVCRGMAFALNQFHQQGKISFNMLSLYDTVPNQQYLAADLFEGLGGRSLRGIIKAIQKGIRSDQVILSHINLAPIGLAIKLIRPKTKVILWTHGIEVWRPINFLKKWFLQKVDVLIAVSGYTAKSLEIWHQVASDKIQVIPNALDPFFVIPQIVKSNYLQNKYDIPSGVPIFMALTRLKGSERNKNYDKVIRLLGELKKDGKTAYYILCGKHDEQEHERINAIAKEADLENEVILSGFVAEEEITNYYLSADAFVLPSVKEGFGLVFVEAQACGLSVLAGNQDGSTEAVRNEQAGILVDPADDVALKLALEQLILKSDSIEEKLKRQKNCLRDFGFERFAKDIEGLVLNESLK